MVARSVPPARSPLPLSKARATARALLVTERLSDQLAARLMAKIEQGALHPGDKLPTEAQLSMAHGVSRSVVREAVHQLKSRGLLHSRQGSGVFVASASALQPLVFDTDAVMQIVELRRVLEGEIAALAAQRATRAQVAGLRKALKAIDSAMAQGADGVAEDMAFHRAIGAATGNPLFSRLLAFLEQHLLEAMRVTKGNESHRSDFMEQVRIEHRAVVDAIAARDAALARRNAIEHLLRADWRLQEGGVIARKGAKPTRSRSAHK